jgi:predicted KAP-like P-loop ATPase
MVTHQSETTEVSVSLIEQGDAPIATLSEDRLGRRSFAEALAAEVMAAPAAGGYVMGLTGPWGSGKTSILNMTADAIGDDAIVVQFNPWMFSGTEALVSSFFEEIGRQLDKRDSKLKGIADKMATYGRLLSPLASLVGAGAAVTTATNLLEKAAARPSVFDQRQELRSMLEKLDSRLVVIVDDVDRLRPQEVLDIVRLVRLVGDFPNTLYLLAFDRGRVEECLGEGNVERGRAYLEKIVQVTHDVPAARQPDVAAIFLDGLEQLVKVVPTGPLNRGDWQNIFTFVVRPLLETPRHVRRLLGSLSMTMRLIGDEVALADLIGIEAVRVLRPAMFKELVSAAEYLSARSRILSPRGYQQGRSAAESPIGSMLQVNAELAQNVCRWLFPASREYFENMHHGPEWEAIWKGERKVASEYVLHFYLERQLPEGVVPARAVDDALARLGDRDSLQAFLDAFSPAELMDLIERMNPAIEKLPVATDHTGKGSCACRSSRPAGPAPSAARGCWARPLRRPYDGYAAYTPPAPAHT